MSVVYLLLRQTDGGWEGEDGVEVGGVFATPEAAMASPEVTIPKNYRRERWGWREIGDGAWGIRRLDTKRADYTDWRHMWTIEPRAVIGSPPPPIEQHAVPSDTETSK